LFFLIFITDLPRFVRDKSVPILFAGETNILLSCSDALDFNTNSNTVLKF
jgi:hypothetical protein